MINIGIIGCGFVGGALKDWLEHNNPERHVSALIDRNLIAHRGSKKTGGYYPL